MLWDTVSTEKALQTLPALSPRIQEICTGKPFPSPAPEPALGSQRHPHPLLKILKAS